MYYINDSITSITSKWLSQLLQKVEANKLWSWGEAEKSEKILNSVKTNKIVVQIYWTHALPVRPPDTPQTAILHSILQFTKISKET